MLRFLLVAAIAVSAVSGKTCLKSTEDTAFTRLKATFSNNKLGDQGYINMDFYTTDPRNIEFSRGRFHISLGNAGIKKADNGNVRVTFEDNRGKQIDEVYAVDCMNLSQRTGGFNADGQTEGKKLDSFREGFVKVWELRGTDWYIAAIARFNEESKNEGKAKKT